MISILRPFGSGKVVAMDRFRSGAGLSPIRQAEAYWTALRSGTDIPFRSQIDPRGLDKVLEFAFVLERVAPGIARFRLAGQHLCALAGMEVRGMPLTAMFTPAARSQISATLEHVFDTPAIAELTLEGEKQSLRGSCEARMILLPLKSDLGDTTRILGVLIADGDFGRQPRRFDVTGSSLRDLTPAPPKPAAISHAVDGFAEAQTALSGKVPYLRLVKSDKS
jgi:hypothetical protein